MAFLRHLIHVVATLLLVAVPGVVALDYGGALPWTIWILSAMAVLLVVMVACGDSQASSSWDALLHELHLASTGTNPASRPGDQSRLAPQANPSSAAQLLNLGSRWTPLLLVLCFAFVAMLQTMLWGNSTVEWASPASANAYQAWAPEAIGEAAPERFTVSVSPWLTTNFTARAIILAAFAYVAGCLMRNRHFVLAMLAGLACIALIHAATGHYQQAFSPHVNLFGSRRVGQPFGTFVNRSHAGALLNIGLACAIGLISVRLHGHRDYPSRRQHGLHGSFQRLLVDRTQTLLFDKPSLFLSLGVVFIVSAILACGSRGALLGMAAGTLACAACTVSTQRLPLFLLTAAFIAFIALVTLGKTGIEASSLERFAESSPSMTQNNARLQHWPDGLRAAWESLPMGGGLGAYRYAHLPYQETSGPNWFQNADNQWVEWLAEGGVPITGALLCALATTLASLRRLLGASDPVNRGLAVAGVFAVAAIGVSQTFDFALTVSSVALAATLLAAAIHARAAHAPLAMPRSSTFHWVGPIFLLVLVAWAQKQIHSEASVMATLNRSKAQLADAKLEYTDLLTQEQILDRAIEQVPDCNSLLNQQCIVQQKLYRIERIGRLLSQQRISLEEAAQRTRLSQIHANKDQLGAPPLHEDPRLQRIAELSRRELELCPLSETARWNLALLDFSADYQTRAPLLLEQLSTLRCRNGDLLARVAALAWQIDKPELATQTWRQLLSVDERRLPEVIEQLTTTGGSIQLHQVLPIDKLPADKEPTPKRELLLRAAESQLQLPPQQRDPIVLGWAMDLLRLPISPAERDLKARLAHNGAK